jgi:methionyl-tRNA formyltransferase
MQVTKERVRILFFLGQHFGVLLLNKLKYLFDRSDCKVVTYFEDSDSYYGYESVIDYCKKNQIDFLDTSTSGKNLLDFCSQFNPSIVICGYYAKILPAEIFGLARDGTFNVHPGKLPLYRGPFPTAWALINGEQDIGITVHQMDSQIDTGPIVAQKTYAIFPDETGFELYKRSMELSAECLASLLPDLLNKNYNLTGQEGCGTGSYYGRVDPHYHIDWKDHVERIRNCIRVHSKPYFPAYSFLKNKIVLINRCRIRTDLAIKLQGPGRILDVTSNNTFLVSCGDGIIEVTDYEVCPLDDGRMKEEFIRRNSRLL